MRWLSVAAILLSSGLPATAGAATCVDVSFQPADHLQLAVWVEDDAGHFVDTVYVTRATGALGLANRPGNARFKSGYRWPYGRREMVLPVWAHRRNHSYGYIVMGGKSGVDPHDDSIGYHEAVSSNEPFYCPPSSLTLDATSCASPFVGSKGLYLAGMQSLYPPRADLSSFDDRTDSDDARQFAADNDLAAISGATPPGGQLLSPTLSWVLPANLPLGTYHVLVEASLEGDFNPSQDHPSFLDINAGLSNIGHDILGQPSIVYSVAIAVDGAAHTAVSDDWLGYGSWDGSNGDLTAPDGTISDAPGSGAGRLAHISDGDGSWRLKVSSSSCTCSPASATGPVAATPGATTATLAFTAPTGARQYEIRYRPSTALDDDNFTDGIPAEAPPTPGLPGAMQTVTLTGLKPETLYYVGVRALNACGTPSAGEFTSFTTAQAKFVTLSGCFVATAAWGSPMAPSVALLRRFRDRALLSSAIGRLAVAVYYATSPPLAAAISSDERLRGLARRLLAPAVLLARAWLLFEDSQP